MKVRKGRPEVGGESPDDGDERAAARRAAPEEARDERKEEGRLESPEGDEVDPDDDVGGAERKEKRNESHREGCAPGEAEKELRTVGDESLLAEQVLHERGRGVEHEGAHGRKRRGERSHEGEPGPEGRHVVRDQIGNDAVGGLADEFDGEIEDAAREHAEEGHADHEEPADDGPDQHGAVEFVASPVGEAAHRGVRKRDRAEAYEKPGREKQPPGKRAARVRGRERSVDFRERQKERLEVAAAEIDDLPTEQEHPAHHEEGADRVRDDDRAVASERRVEDRDESEENEARLVGKPRRRGEEPRAPDELPCHHGDEGDEEREREKAREPRIGKARADEVDHGDGADAVADDRELLSDHAEDQKARDDLGRREDDPAEAELPGDARSRHKRAHRPVGGDHAHGEDEALEIAVGEIEVLERLFRRLSVLKPDRREKQQEKKENDREEEKKFPHASSPLVAPRSEKSRLPGRKTKRTSHQTTATERR